jgi:hypothetical protein
MLYTMAAFLLVMTSFSGSQLGLTSVKFHSTRLLDNIFNWTDRQHNSDSSPATSLSKNAESDELLLKRSAMKVKAVVEPEERDLIPPENRRRLGVGQMSIKRTKYRNPGAFMEGNENMHFFLDKMMMSMITEVCITISSYR